MLTAKKRNYFDLEIYSIYSYLPDDEPNLTGYRKLTEYKCSVVSITREIEITI